jgi:hypothetical protein
MPHFDSGNNNGALAIGISRPALIASARDISGSLMTESFFYDSQAEK